MKKQNIPLVPYTFRHHGKDVGVPWLATLFVCDYRSAKSGRWHTHEQIELVCRLKGELGYDFKGRSPLTLHQGQALVIPAGTVHRLSGEIDSPGLRICLLIDEDARNLTQKAILCPPVFRRLLALLTDKALAPFSIPIPLLESLKRLALLAGADDFSADPLQRAQFQLIATEILFLLATTANPCNLPSNQIIDRAKDYLKSRMSEKVRMSELLGFIGYGQSQFFRLFRRETGSTPNEWLCRKRIERACELLTDTSSEVREIAERTGFPDAAYFSRVFKRYIGQSPIAYRATRAVRSVLDES